MALTVIQWLGVVILALALLQAVLTVSAMFHRQRFVLLEHHLKLEHLKYQGNMLQNHQRQLQLSWTGYRKFIVTKKVEECDAICSFYLKPHDGLPIPDFRPGQHLTFSLRAGPNNKPVVRCYSLSEAPEGKQQAHYRVSVKRLPPPPDKPDAPAGLVSGFWHEQIQESDLIDVKAPSGQFFLQEQSTQPVVLIAGGVGVTPMLCMFQHLIRQGSRREVWFFYGVDHRHQVMALQEIQEAAAKAANIHLRLAFSNPTEQCVPGQHYHREGYVSVDWIRECMQLSEAFNEIPEYRQPEFYICGPVPMMQSISAGLEQWGAPSSMVYSEAFGPASIKRAKPKAEDGEQAEEQFTVQFKRSGRTLQWSTADGSLLEFAEENNLALDAGCRCGECGTCEIAIIEGQIVYPDRDPQFDLTANSCLACVGVPGSDLVLDA